MDRGLLMGQRAAYRVMELLWGRAGLIVALVVGQGADYRSVGQERGRRGWLWFWLGASHRAVGLLWCRGGLAL